MNDWNHNGKNDSFDNYVDYKLSSEDRGSTGGRAIGEMSALGGFLCMIAGLAEESVLFTVLDIDVDKVPVLVHLILWILGAALTGCIATIIRDRKFKQ